MRLRTSELEVGKAREAEAAAHAMASTYAAALAERDAAVDALLRQLRTAWGGADRLVVWDGAGAGGSAAQVAGNPHSPAAVAALFRRHCALAAMLPPPVVQHVVESAGRVVTVPQGAALPATCAVATAHGAAQVAALTVLLAGSATFTPPAPASGVGLTATRGRWWGGEAVVYRTPISPQDAASAWRATTDVTALLLPVAIVRRILMSPLGVVDGGWGGSGGQRGLHVTLSTDAFPLGQLPPASAVL
jgi:hypothetical protein